jgi:hypothetical protein
MMCFKDMTFCASDCVRAECHRHWDEEKRATAKQWWGSDEAPVMFSDYSKTCPDYVKGDVE